MLNIPSQTGQRVLSFCQSDKFSPNLVTLPDLIPPYCLTVTISEVRAAALVQWLWEESHVPKIMGLNPSTIYWMDFFSSICCKIVMLFEKTKINDKEAGDSLFKKKQFLRPHYVQLKHRPYVHTQDWTNACREVKLLYLL